MRTLTIIFQFPDGAEARAVHSVDFPGQEVLAQWSGATDRLPPDLIAKARTQDGLAARCSAEARTIGIVLSIEVEGGYKFAD
jgi:hypothetical protein